MAALQVVLALIPCIIVYVQCTPIEKLWNPSLPGHCWDPSILNDITYFMTAYTIMTDIALAAMPITAFWKLHMRTSTKIGLCLMMGLTLFSAVVTMVKATYLHLFTDKTDPREYIRHSWRIVRSRYTNAVGSLECCSVSPLGPVSINESGYETKRKP